MAKAGIYFFESLRYHHKLITKDEITLLKEER